MIYKVTLNGKVYEVEVERGEAVLLNEYEACSVSVPETAAPTAVPAQDHPAVKTQGAAAEGTQVRAPLPGNVLAIKVQQGDAVKAGQVLLTVEAMKMENEVVSPCDGVVKSIAAAKGALVATGDLLMVI